jgi:hypothetical protein
MYSLLKQCAAADKITTLMTVIDSYKTIKMICMIIDAVSYDVNLRLDENNVHGQF